VSEAAVMAGLAAALGIAGAGVSLSSLQLAGRGTAAESGRAEPRLSRFLRRAARGLVPPRDLEARIAAAGRPANLGARELMAAKLGAAVLAGVASLAFGAMAPGRLAFLLLVAAPVAGFLAPDFWLARHTAQRARVMRAELPPLLDLLRVCVESGSSLAESLRAVGARTRGPLAAEWRAIGRQVALGVPLETALAGMAERAPIPEVQTLTAALLRARRHGAPLAETLTAQARDARFALARHAREQAARAGPKIQLVVALLLVPSVLLLVAAALLAALLDGGAASLFPT
jgi:tight adherence protein C